MRKIYTTIFMASILAFTSCQKEFGDPENPPSQDEKETVDGLGKKLENPYSVKNMKRAIQLLMSVAPDANYPELNSLEPTHYYVRFLPKDTTELVIGILP